MDCEKKSNMVNFAPIVVLVLALCVLGFSKYHDYEKTKAVAEKHIQIVTATDRNCNDCHLGASFVNLFNNPAVKDNDNVVIAIMDKAKIKRW